MRTEELVAMLAQGAVAVEPDVAARRFRMALGWGLFIATLAMAVWLDVRPDIREASMLPMFWMKIVFSSLVAFAALYAAMRLSQPGARQGSAPFAIAALFLLAWALGALALMNAAPAARAAMIFGQTWKVCPFNIAALAVPLFAAAMWAMKGLAPTRPALAGAAAGLLAGGAASAVYSLHCPEMEMPFFAIWYVLGMFIPVVAGALVGPRLLRW